MNLTTVASQKQNKQICKSQFHHWTSELNKTKKWTWINSPTKYITDKCFFGSEIDMLCYTLRCLLSYVFIGFGFTIFQLVAADSTLEQNVEKPHIIFILADDLVSIYESA